MKVLALALLFFCLSGLAVAQNKQVPLEFDGQIRMRSEADGRDFDSDSDPNNYTFLRTRFGVNAMPAEDVSIYVQAQDSRALGIETSTLSDESNIDLHQAFFEVRNLWGKPIAFRGGRQELSYGHERVIGAVGWSNVGRAFDGVKITIGRKSTLDILAMTITERNTPAGGAATPVATAGIGNPDLEFAGLYYQNRRKANYLMDLYVLAEVDSRQTSPGEKDLERATIGAYNKGKLGALDFETELALQAGKITTAGIRRDVLAFMLTGSLSHTFDTSRKPTVGAGIDYLSGMEPGDDKYMVFNTLYATNHQFYGLMDYFLDISAQTNGLGLQDIMLKGGISLTGNLRGDLHIHNFRTAKGSEKNLGNEVDLVLNYRHSSVFSVLFGFSIFSPGDLMEARFGSDGIGYWSFTSLQAEF
jgi:hypothetical protein